jgi:hypothetical protein
MPAVAESTEELDVSVGSSERIAELNYQQKNRRTGQHTGRG